MNRPDKLESTLAEKVTRGAAWTLSFRIVDRLIGMASTLILVRLLSPADFGIVAMAMTIIALLEVFTIAEFSSAIIQHPSPSRDYYDSAWTLSFVLGAVSTLLMLLFAGPIAGFFNEPQLAPVIVALSLIPLVDGLFNMGCVDFRKYLQFRKDFIFMTGRKLAGVIAVIPLAFIFRSYWALVGGMIAGRLAGLALSYLLHPFRPKFSFGSAAPLFTFSRWIILNNALTFLSTRGAHLLIGRVSGATTLGIYTVAHEMASLPTTELAAPINRVMFPAYSTLSHDFPALRHGFLKVLGLIALLAIPAGLGMASVAHLFVPVVLGDKWHAATPVIEILAVAGAIYVLQANIESLYFSLGKPRYKAVVTLAEACLFLPLAYYLLPRYGLEGVASAFLVCASITVPANFLFATRLIGLRASQALGALWRPLAAGAIMAIVVLLAFPPSDVARDVWSNSRALALAILLGASVYATSLTLLWLASGRPPGAEEWVWSQIKPRLGRIAGGGAGGT